MAEAAETAAINYPAWTDYRFRGAERLVRLRVTDGVSLADALPLAWTAADFSPQLAGTGTWRDGER